VSVTALVPRAIYKIIPYVSVVFTVARFIVVVVLYHYIDARHRNVIGARERTKTEREIRKKKNIGEEREERK
jgi:hypothetical protein